jgi:signal transduction histidine kinase
MDTSERINILMVDDSPSKLLGYEAILSELDENLIKAGSANEALEALLKYDIGVILLDVVMPEIDGFQLVRIIREHPRFQKTPIIFISAIHMTDLDRVKGYERGAVDYISVPINPELLRAKVSVFTELHRRTRQLERMNLELAHLSARLMGAQDEERRRIARELHDSLGQDLTAAKVVLDRSVHQGNAEALASRVAEATTLIDRAIQQVRSISHLLHPPMLDEIGLGSAVTWFVEGFSKRTGIETSIEVEPPDFPRLKPELETAIFRIIQEALTNVFRHSAGTKAWVSMAKRNGQLVACVRDDGKGLTPEVAQVRPDSIGVGIAGMRQRVKELGGEFQLRNANPGTVVEAIINVTD